VFKGSLIKPCLRYPSMGRTSLALDYIVFDM
jgi:hypothetical protein